MAHIPPDDSLSQQNFNLHGLAGLIEVTVSIEPHAPPAAPQEGTAPPEAPTSAGPSEAK